MLADAGISCHIRVFESKGNHERVGECKAYISWQWSLRFVVLVELVLVINEQRSYKPLICCTNV